MPRYGWHYRIRQRSRFTPAGNLTLCSPLWGKTSNGSRDWPQQKPRNEKLVGRWGVVDERGHMKPEYGTEVQVPPLWHTVWTSEGNVQPFAPRQEAVTGDTLLTDHFRQEFNFRGNCWEWLYSTWPHSIQSANTWNHLPGHATDLAPTCQYRDRVALRVSPGTWHQDTGSRSLESCRVGFGASRQDSEENKDTVTHTCCMYINRLFMSRICTGSVLHYFLLESRVGLTEWYRRGGQGEQERWYEHREHLDGIQRFRKCTKT